jgi:hypothetical protein
VASHFTTQRPSYVDCLHDPGKSSGAWQGLPGAGSFKVCLLLKLCVASDTWNKRVNLLKPTGYFMHQQFNIQQMYVLPTLYLCVLYLSENKQRLVLLTA